MIDVIVVGCGIMGAATARALARAGHSVTILERFAIGNEHGSSHGSARIFRLSYRDPAFVAMGREALPLWHALEAEAGESLLRTTGAVWWGDDIDDIGAALRRNGVEHAFVDGAEAMQRYPSLRFDRDQRALREPGAGVIAADRAWRALVASARLHGAELHENVVVEAVREDARGVEVVTRGVTLHARAAVITAGPWTGDLVNDLPVRTTHETVAYIDDGGVEIPVIVETGAVLRFALPVPEGGIKAGEHGTGSLGHPDDAGEPDTEAAARVAAWVHGRAPNSSRHASHAETCWYTNTPDETFILERRGKIVVGSPCSGHGFKFAPLIGSRLAAMAATP